MVRASVVEMAVMSCCELPFSWQLNLKSLSHKEEKKGE
jgi:hypothetical protein